MAVIVQYIVVRNGVQKMTFTTKKEADQYDKMLDIADHLYEWIEATELEMEEKHLEDLTLFLAQNKDKAISILRGVKPKPEPEIDPEKTQEVSLKTSKKGKTAEKKSPGKIRGKIPKKK